MDAHEEAALKAVVELLALQDVPGVVDQEAADGVDQSGLVGTGQGEDELASGVGARWHDILQRCVMSNSASNTQHGPRGRLSGQGRCLIDVRRAEFPDVVVQ